MGTLTRSQFVSEITKNLGGRGDEARIIIHLNMAQERIKRRRVWPELNLVDQVTVTPVGNPETDRYHDITSGGMIKVQHLYGLVRIFSGERPFPLVAIPSRQWMAFVGKTTGLLTGDPTHYNKWRPGYVEFFRAPTRAFDLVRRYRIFPTEFDAVNDVASDFEAKDDIIINYATSSLFHSLGMLEDAGRYFTVANELMKDALTEAMATPDQSIIGRGESVAGSMTTDYVTDPFVKRAP